MAHEATGEVPLRRGDVRSHVDRAGRTRRCARRRRGARRASLKSFPFPRELGKPVKKRKPRRWVVPVATVGKADR